MIGAMPSRNVGPGWVRQHDKRNHQIAVQNQTSTVAMYRSSTRDERILAGTCRKRTATRIPPRIGARKKKSRSQRRRGAYAMEMQMKQASSALLVAAIVCITKIW